MRVRATVVREGVAPQDAVINVDDGTTAAEVAAAVDRLYGRGSPVSFSTQGVVTPLAARAPAWQRSVADAGLWVDGRLCEPEAKIGSALRDGVRLTTDPSVGPFMVSGEPVGRYEVTVSGGAGAGRVARLSAGVSTIGSAPTATLRVEDPNLAQMAARVTVDVKGRVEIAPCDGAELTLDDEPVSGTQEWQPGVLLKSGESLFSLSEVSEPDAHLSPAGAGGLAYNRPPRLTSPRAKPRLVVPAPPTKDEAQRFQLLSAVLPLFFGVGMYFVTKMIYMLLFCLLSPIMIVGQWVSDRRHGKKKYRAAMKEYKKAKADHEAEVERLSERDQRRRREAYPDPGQLLLFATGPRRRLWERRITDPDAMHLRVGFSDLRAEIDLANARTASADTDEPEPPVVSNVPLTLPFAELGVVGIAGDRPRAVASTRWMAAQAAVLHSPRDLSLVVLSSATDAAQNWSWAQWLPHTSPQQGQNCVALMGTDAESISRRVAELLAELTRRQAAAKENGGLNVLRPDPQVLLILDGARLLRRVPGVPQLLQEGPAHGILALCVDEDERLLPEECRTAICWTPESASRVHLRGYGYEAAGDVLADQVSIAWCERVARALAPVVDVSRDDADSALPTAARLLELLEMPNPTGADIASIWQRGGATTAAPIGLAADGPFVLDIRRDGPHALIAGTTGAGKSELLQTIIASLAVGNTPDSLNFVLIDYKGGSAFQDCARLPHTVGMVSDLDAHLTERALASLAAELKRREEILFEAETKDIEDYNDARRLRHELEPMPRLVLVIDEFASLVAELPDFIAGLVDIARRGRSLGVHLMLATQRPAGVVSADIRANTNLRIALRVTNGEESRDVIDAPDAGNISKATPGRCYVRSGAQSLIGVQSARIGGRRPGLDTAPQVTLSLLDWVAYGHPPPRGTQEAGGDDGTMVTDLAVLVEAISAGAQQLGCATPRSPWLPPIPSQVVTSELPALPAAGPSADTVRPVAFGLTDLPAQQARAALALDLADGEHLMIAGGPRSGRSTGLRTIAGVLAQNCAPNDVHIYGIDCGANALLPLTSLPHCGAVVTRDQTARVDRLLGRLLAEVTRRQMLLAEKGQSSAAEQRAAAEPEDRLPWMVVLIDGWDAFRLAFENYDYGRLVESAKRLFREGAAVGVKVVLATDRSGLMGEIASSFAERLVLRLADPQDYSFAGITPKDVPKEVPSGRALKGTDDGVQESQIALLAENPSGQAQVAALQEIARVAAQTWARPAPHQRPVRVDVLPARIKASEAMALQPDFTPPSELWALFAAGGDELSPLGMDLEESGPGFVISGPPKSGRSSTLVAAAMSLLGRGTEVILITPRRSPLRDLASEPGVLGTLDSESSSDDLEALTGSARGPYVILVDDAELIYDTPLDEALEEQVRRGMDGGLGLIAAGAVDTLSSQYRGFVVQARRSRNGLLLSPQGTADGEMFNIRLSSNSGGGGPTGRGLFVQGGEVSPAQAVLPD